MTGKGISHGAITVINAMPNGIGATIGVELRTEASFVPNGDTRTVTIENDPQEKTKMAEICVRKAFEMMKKEEPLGWTLTINSDIPISRGLKSSSSACNAILKSVFNEYKFKYDTEEMIKLGVECAKEANVTVTGSFDDACGCELGGLVVTDNTENEIISLRPIDIYDVVLYIPDKKIRKDTINRNIFAPVVNQIEAAQGISELFPLKAMTMNGRIISEAMGLDNSVAEMAMNNGALGAGLTGSGPAIAIVLNEGRGKAFIERTKLTNTILTRTRSIQQ